MWNGNLILVWYVISGGLIAVFLGLYRLLNQQKFRSSGQDITTEVGYEQDSVGQHVEQRGVRRRRGSASPRTYTGL